MIFQNKRFDDGSLRLQGAAEIEDVAFQYGYFEHHLLLFTRKHLCLDKVELLADVVESWEAGVQENFENMVEERCWGVFTVETALALAFLEHFEKCSQLVDTVFVTGDQVFVGQDDIKLAWVGGAELGIEEGDVNGKKQTAVVLDDFGLIGWRDQLFDSQRVDVEVLLKIGDIILSGVFKINPSDLFVLNGFHLFWYFVSFKIIPQNIDRSNKQSHNHGIVTSQGDSHAST